MKKILITLTMAILLPASAFASKKKDQPQPQDAQAQNGTDWLNAPTPDGSPTLKETGDWLAKTLHAYGGWRLDFDISFRIDGVHIDNDCSFHYSIQTRDKDKHDNDRDDFSVPLGAVTHRVGLGARSGT